MKYISQAAIIFGITMLGELLSVLLPLPVPAGVYGLFLLLLCLCTGLVKLPQVDFFGTLLLDLMPLMFIPATVKLLVTFEEIRPILLPLCVILVVTTVVVMAVTGRTAQFLLRDRKRACQEVQ